MFNSDVLSAIVQHAEAEFPKESCGFVLNDEYVPIENVHDEPTKHFAIHPKEYINANRVSTLQAIVHSHPNGELEPSWDDLQVQLKTNVPWVIAPKGSRLFWFGEGVPIEPLLGRTFRFNVQDCAVAARDWFYDKYQIKVNLPPRKAKWWKEDQYWAFNQLKECGFVAVSGDYLEGDILLMTIGSAVMSHLAVCLGGDKMYHHLVNSISKVEPIHNWKSCIVAHMRYTKW